VDRKTLIYGTIAGVILGIAANAYSLATIVYPCVNCKVSYGIPFKLAEMGGLYRDQRIFWDGLATDLLIFLVIGILLVAAGKALSRRRRIPRLE
jgi:H+/Cl- antiporter ClcA